MQALEDMGRKYWKKRSYIFQGFVVTNPIDEKDAPENPIRRFIISPQIFKILKGALMDPDMETVPTDYDAGTDFRLIKTQNGQYADYGTSNWARKERSLNELERAAIEQYGLNDLNDFMPKKPNAEELAAIMEMFEASVDGELYDPARWANFYRPYGIDLGEFNPKSNSGSNSGAAPASTPAKKAPVEDDDIPFDSNEEAEAKKKAAPVSSPAKPKQDASDILAMIRQRKAD